MMMLPRLQTAFVFKLVSVFLVLAVALASGGVPKLSRLRYMQAYSRASVTCIKENVTLIENNIKNAQSASTGYCSTQFPSSFQCVDKLAFLDYCQYVEKERATSNDMGMAIIFVFFLIMVGMVAC